MSGADLLTSAIIGIVLVLVSAAVGLYFRRTKPKETRVAIKNMQDRMDRSLEGSDDPNEPARWMP